MGIAEVCCGLVVGNMVLMCYKVQYRFFLGISLVAFLLLKAII